jgi:hypothetical protein
MKKELKLKRKLKKMAQTIGSYAPSFTTQMSLEQYEKQGIIYTKEQLQALKVIYQKLISFSF